MADGRGWWARQTTGTKTTIIVIAVVLIILIIYFAIPGEQPPAEMPGPPAEGQG